jgi:hypothetical protein
MRFGLTMSLMLAALCAASNFAQARPPTVTNSPGYDARLKESRSALSGSPATTAPTTPVPAPKHSKKKRTN